MKKYLLLIQLLGFTWFSSLGAFFNNGGSKSYSNYEAVYEASNLYAKEFARNNNLYHFHTGDGVSSNRSWDLCTFALMSYDEMSIENAQKLAHRCVDNYIIFLKEQPSVHAYFPPGIKEFSELHPGFQTNYVGVRIGFWTKEMNRIMPPYIAEIRFFDNVYHYYQANPETQELILIHEEPYQNPS